MKKIIRYLWLMPCLLLGGCSEQEHILLLNINPWALLALLMTLASGGLSWLLIRAREKYRRRMRKLAAELHDARELMNKLQHQCTRLNEEVEERDFFFSLVVHDLKSPLRFLMMRARQLADDVDRENFTLTREAVSELWVEATAVYHLALDMLLLQEIRTLKDLPQAQRVDIGALMKDVVDLYVKVVAAKGNHLELKIAQGLELLMPYELIKVVVRNLLDNANKFTSNGHILVITLLHEKYLSIVVEDSGVGMDDRQVHMLMNASPANRVSIARTFGVGYTVIHTLISKMDGKISIVSMPGKGTKVTVRIPVQVSSTS